MCICWYTSVTTVFRIALLTIQLESYSILWTSHCRMYFNITEHFISLISLN